ncbi:ATPase-like, ATP-binding domain protein [Cordyceps fumosorosea ARSEF 2679]|uniref:histidine kinase n=1 Tax=Cordyceps fumosorosea (strain ARSEF 2679) TaxID=1081104 RepID=A0A167N6H2_CORFA|nr:ATPase-like, ATP-binding domain protein [Cordyceps fumosorosea ARSEF 2679]OAA55187.1 ATPase-like, ATP-binding domain protein [Cordyceps fumosorosea ARSEF 2679]
MRVPIWVQLALLVSGVALLALTVVAVPTWIYVQGFVINVETDSLALAASLYATKIDAQLQLLNTISRTVSTRILIQQSLANFYNNNATTSNPFEPTVTDLQSALATSSFTGLLQARIYSRNQTGENSTGLVSVTGSGVGTQTQNIPLPYLTPDGLSVNLSDTKYGYPPSLYPNITYETLDIPNPYIPSEKAVAASAFPGVLLSDSRGLLLGPLAVNQTFALISLTIPIRSLTSNGFILGYLTLVAAANSFLDIQTAVDGLGKTGVALLVTPNDPSNRFTPPLLPSNATYQPPSGSLSDYAVRIVLSPATHPGQVDRHTDKQGKWDAPFPLSRYPAINGAYSTYNGNLNNARASLTTTNEQGYAVAVGVARPQTTLVDWVIVVEKSRDEAYLPISLLRKILVGCAFGTAGLVMLLVIPCAYFSVRPIRRLKTATEKSINVPGYDLQYGDDEKKAASAGGTLSSASIKSLFQSIVMKFSKPQRPLTQAEIENHRRVFKIPGRVKERSHIITDEVTELTEVYNKMTDELVRQYTSLDDQVAKRTKELEISKKAAEAANESKTLFIANISHELKTPLNGIMGICAVCMEENDILHIQHSLKTLYRSEDLLSFSKNQISHEIKLEHKEFRLGEIRSQIVSIFEKQARESKIDLEVIFSGRSSENLNPPRLLVQQGLPRAGQSHRIRDMYILGDQHRILQVIINLVSNSLKFTTAGGKVQVRIHWGDNVVSKHDARNKAVTEGSPTQSDSSHEEATSWFQSLSRVTTPAVQTVTNPLDQKGVLSDPHVMFDEETQSSLTQTIESANEYLFTFEVEDTGRGIPLNMQDKIFEPFVQVDSSFSKEFGGTGLGLSICSQLATLMGGKITVKSSEGLGSTFSLQIPLKHIIDRVPSTRSESTRPRSRAPSAGGSTTNGGGSGHRNSLSSVLAQDADTTTTTNHDNHRSDIQPRLVGLSTPFFPPNPNQATAPPPTGSTTVIPPTTSGETQAAIQKAKADKAKDSSGQSGTGNSDLCVLVADDNATNIEVVRRMLKLEKVLDVTIAKDGREAYELVKENMERNRKFDLIFMDVQMPNLDGIQSTRLIRQMGYAAPIVALTAFSEESNRKECMESGMDEFLAKPIRRSALKSVLTKFATIDEEKLHDMPLDTSTYSLALLRVDGRRWNELRRLHALIRTQDAADGSSYLEMGHTKVMCVVSGPSEPQQAQQAQQRRGGQATNASRDGAAVSVNIVIAGFSSVDRKKRGRNDKRIQEMEITIAKAFASNLHTHIFPHSTISISLHVLSQDGSLLAALLNAATLALVDAGVPMSDYIAACTAGSTSSFAAGDDAADPLLDLNGQEEQELPHLTVATLGEGDRVAVLACESRIQVSRFEGMLVVGLDGCKQVRRFLDGVVKAKGGKMIREGAIQQSDTMVMDLDE